MTHIFIFMIRLLMPVMAVAFWLRKILYISNKDTVTSTSLGHIRHAKDR